MSLADLFLAGRFKGMVLYYSIPFMAFFLPCALLLYTVVPAKAKKYCLLFISLLYYWLTCGKLIGVLLLSVLSIHYFGIWIDRIYRQRDRAFSEVEKSEKKAIRKKYRRIALSVLAFAVLLHLGFLLTIKYSMFFATNVNNLLQAVHLPLKLRVPHYLMPLGISFFTLQAVSYLIDVYRETIPADSNPFRLALFLTFFPQIVEGPICRYKQTAEALWSVGPIRYRNLTHGAQRMLYGLLKTIVIADRLNPMVNAIFDHYPDYNGGMMAVAMLGYTIQLYMDFSGTMDAVVGMGEIFGVVMPENFARPFFSRTISEFWQRWHITLGTWFKDYLFYPITMSGPMKKLTSSARKKIGNHFGPLFAGSIALFCVWLSNGLWHGSAWNYIFFGMYHFVLILFGNMMVPAVKLINHRLHISPERFWYWFLQILRSGILVMFGELFFRANGLRAGLFMFRRIMSDFSISGISGEALMTIGLDTMDMLVIAVTMLIVFVVSLLNEKGIHIRESVQKTPIIIRYAVWLTMITFIVIFGAYGAGYVPVDPMYANF